MTEVALNMLERYRIVFL